MSDADLDHLESHIKHDLAALEMQLRIARNPEEPEITRAVRFLTEARAAISNREGDRQLGANVLAHRAGLTSDEMHVVWLLAGIAAYPAMRTSVMQLTGETTPDPSLAAIKLVVNGSRPSAAALTSLRADGALRRLGIIERSDGDSAVHESRQTWAIAPRVLAFLHGIRDEDARLGVARVPTAIDDLAVALETLGELRKALRDPSALVVLAGLPGSGRRTLATSVAAEAGLAVLEVDAARLPRDVPQLRAIARECVLVERALLLANLDVLAEDRLALVAAELLPLVPRVIVTCARRPIVASDRPVVAVDMKPPTSTQRASLWIAALGHGNDGDADILAGQYPLAPGLIVRAARAARARAGGEAVSAEDIYAGVRAVLDDRLGQYARRVEVTQRWDDLVVRGDQLAELTELIARIRERRTVYEQWGFAGKVGKGLGVAALFSGPPGTAKTMAAALAAREVGLELYQIDLAKVVSKWVGETERNLAAVFDAAEAGHAILLFDEADALFGKRTDVRSSNDRYANLETNYLLQRLESFTGICLLTSNHEQSIDPAFPTTVVAASPLRCARRGRTPPAVGRHDPEGGARRAARPRRPRAPVPADGRLHP